MHDLPSSPHESYYRASATLDSYAAIEGQANAAICVIGGGFVFGGHGVAPTTLTGELLSRRLLGEPGVLDGFVSCGLPSTGGVAGLLAAQLAYWYDELRDWMRE